MKLTTGSALAGADPELVCLQAQKITTSHVFVRSQRLCRFLKFTVEQTLENKGMQLKERVVGAAVFDRRLDYDPATDPIVRVEARRLRAKLKAYYTSIGRSDGIVIEFPKGTYVPTFRSRTAARTMIRYPRGIRQKRNRSVAVAPFTNLTPNTAADYFSDGLTEELIHSLNRIPELRVLAWNTETARAGCEKDVVAVREQLNPATLLRGCVRRTGSCIRVTAHMIDIASGAYLWSEAYDRQLENVLAIQQEMAQAIVDSLLPNLPLQ